MIATRDGHSINITELSALAELSLKVLGMASVQCSQKRRADLKYKLVPTAKELADRDQPMGPELFGDNIKEHYKQIQDVAKITSLTTTKGKKTQRNHPYMQAFLGRGSGFPQWFPGHYSPRSRGPPPPLYMGYPGPHFPFRNPRPQGRGRGRGKGQNRK